MQKTIYLITGPPGAGKSTTSIEIAKRLERSAYIEGDMINHMVVGGYEKPWLSTFHVNLIWTNIATLTRNFINKNHDVVIDYIVFKENLRYFFEELNGADVVIKLVVLLPNEEELLKRDSQRIPENQMKERCVIVMNELINEKFNDKHLLNSTNIHVDEVVKQIIYEDRFIVHAI